MEKRQLSAKELADRKNKDDDISVTISITPRGYKSKKTRNPLLAEEVPEMQVCYFKRGEGKSFIQNITRTIDTILTPLATSPDGPLARTPQNTEEYQKAAQLIFRALNGEEITIEDRSPETAIQPTHLVYKPRNGWIKSATN